MNSTVKCLTAVFFSLPFILVCLLFISVAAYPCRCVLLFLSLKWPGAYIVWYNNKIFLNNYIFSNKRRSKQQKSLHIIIKCSNWNPPAAWQQPSLLQKFRNEFCSPLGGIAWISCLILASKALANFVVVLSKLTLNDASGDNRLNLMLAP